MKTSTEVERMTAQPESLFYQEHEARYCFAERRLQPGPTLDIASGTGYGTQRLAQQTGQQVIGADVALPALQDARLTYVDPIIDFIAASGTALPFSTGAFENVVTLETLEHVVEAGSFVEEIARVLRVDGTCILSTPNRAYSIRHGIANPYHVREYSEEELLTLLSGYFATTTVYYQGFSTAYHSLVKGYASSIQSRKKKLGPIVPFLIDHLYRPVRERVPRRLVNYFIRRLLGLTYPQPERADIMILEQPLEDTCVYVVVCKDPIRVRHEWSRTSIQTMSLP